MSAAFGTKMKARREALGFTLRDVEEISGGAGLSNAYLSQLENGKIKKPSAQVVLALCAVYAVPHGEALEWLGLPHEIPSPRICSECGRALPFSVIGNATRPASASCADPTEQSIIDLMLTRMIAAKLKQRTLARRLKVSEPRVSQLLRAGSNMTMRTMEAVFAAIRGEEPTS